MAPDPQPWLPSFQFTACLQAPQSFEASARPLRREGSSYWPACQLSEGRPSLPLTFPRARPRPRGPSHQSPLTLNTWSSSRTTSSGSVEPSTWRAMTLSTEPESEAGQEGSGGGPGLHSPPLLATPLRPPTSPQEDDIVGSILGLHAVHHYLAQLLGQLGFDEDRAALPWPHRLEHEWVGSGELQHLVRVVLGVAEGPPRLRSHLARALWAAAVGVLKHLGAARFPQAHHQAHHQALARRTNL